MAWEKGGRERKGEKGSVNGVCDTGDSDFLKFPFRRLWEQF